MFKFGGEDNTSLVSLNDISLALALPLPSIGNQIPVGVDGAMGISRGGSSGMARCTYAFSVSIVNDG